MPFSSRRWWSELLRCRELATLAQDAKEAEGDGQGVRWKGIPLLKDPWDMVLYPILLWELRPASVLELGSFEGGSALWLADTGRALGLDMRVLSLDREPPGITADGVAFAYADLEDPFDALDELALRGLAKPLLIIEDVHVNVKNVLEAMHVLLEPGDYLVVEDTCDAFKYEQFARFAWEHDAEYYVDTSYTDRFGYNVTWNWNSFLVRAQA